MPSRSPQSDGEIGGGGDGCAGDGTAWPDADTPADQGPGGPARPETVIGPCVGFATDCPSGTLQRLSFHP